MWSSVMLALATAGYGVFVEWSQRPRAQTFYSFADECALGGLMPAFPRRGTHTRVIPLLAHSGSTNTRARGH